MSAVAIIVGTIALAVVLAALLPGAGFIGAIAVVWLLSAGAWKQALVPRPLLATLAKMRPSNPFIQAFFPLSRPNG